VSVAGTTACFIAATLGARIFFPWPPALLAGAAAALLEALAGSKLDNLAIPLGTALVLSLAP
jgi:dolichol kinase